MWGERYHMNIDPRTVYIHVQRPAARALIRFCEEHAKPVPKGLRDCLQCLEQNDVAGAVLAYLEVPLGGNGTFNDWYPYLVTPDAEREYVMTIFEALVGHWSLSMRLSMLAETRPRP